MHMLKKKNQTYLLLSKILRIKLWPENTEASAKWIPAGSLWKRERTCLIKLVLTFQNHVSLIFIPWNNKRNMSDVGKPQCTPLLATLPFSNLSVPLPEQTFKIKKAASVCPFCWPLYRSFAPVKLENKKISILFLALLEGLSLLSGKWWNTFTGLCGHIWRTSNLSRGAAGAHAPSSAEPLPCCPLPPGQLSPRLGRTGMGVQALLGKDTGMSWAPGWVQGASQCLLGLGMGLAAAGPGSGWWQLGVPCRAMVVTGGRLGPGQLRTPRRRAEEPLPKERVVSAGKPAGGGPASLCHVWGQRGDRSLGSKSFLLVVMISKLFPPSQLCFAWKYVILYNFPKIAPMVIMGEFSPWAPQWDVCVGNCVSHAVNE